MDGRIGKLSRVCVAALALGAVAAPPAVAAGMTKDAARDACKLEMNWAAKGSNERSSPQTHLALQECIKAKMKGK
jgi:hypothetical protein